MTDHQVDRAALEFLSGEYAAATATIADLVNRAMTEGLPREEVARMATDSFVQAIRAMEVQTCLGRPQSAEQAAMVSGIEHELSEQREQTVGEIGEKS